MTLTAEQAEILIQSSALDSYRLYVARCKRRADQANAELALAYQELDHMEAKLQYMREASLRKGCV